MGKPAARTTDQHSCTQQAPIPPPTGGTSPHIPAPLAGPGCPTVLIGGQAAAVIGDSLICTAAPPATPPPPNSIQAGSATVKFGGKAAARQGDPTAHGGKISTGFATVLIGD